MPTLQLRLLGVAQLSAFGGQPHLVGARTLALLAAAAAGGPQGLSREAAMALLWPDSDLQRGRNSLRQRLFTLRRELGVEPLVQSPESLRLDPGVVAVDLWEFEAALAANQPGLAASLYSGPFMDGFVHSGLGELDRWIEEQRSRLRDSSMRAMDRLAVECTRRSDHAGALEWRRRLAAMDPLSSRVAADLVHALVAFKDRVGAMQHARIHTELVRQQLDTEPDPAFVALVQSLDLRRSPLPVPLRVEPHSDPAYRISDPTNTGAQRGAADTPSGSIPAQSPGPQPTTRRGRRIIAAFALVGVMLVLVASTRDFGFGSASELPLVVVGRFDSPDPAGDPAVGRGVARLLTAALNETGHVRALVSGTSGARAAFIISGSIVQSGNRVTINASLYDVAGQPDTSFTVQGSRERTFELVERLAGQVVAARRPARLARSWHP